MRGKSAGNPVHSHAWGAHTVSIPSRDIRSGVFFVAFIPPPYSHNRQEMTNAFPFSPAIMPGPLVAFVSTVASLVSTSDMQRRQIIRALKKYRWGTTGWQLLEVGHEGGVVLWNVCCPLQNVVS